MSQRQLWSQSGTLAGSPVTIDIQSGNPPGTGLGQTAAYFEIANLSTGATYTATYGGADFAIPPGTSLRFPVNPPNASSFILDGTGDYSVYASANPQALPLLTPIVGGGGGGGGGAPTGAEYLVMTADPSLPNANALDDWQSGAAPATPAGPYANQTWFTVGPLSFKIPWAFKSNLLTQNQFMAVPLYSKDDTLVDRTIGALLANVLDKSSGVWSRSLRLALLDTDNIAKPVGSILLSGDDSTGYNGALENLSTFDAGLAEVTTLGAPAAVDSAARVQDITTVLNFGVADSSALATDAYLPVGFGAVMANANQIAMAGKKCKLTQVRVQTNGGTQFDASVRVEVYSGFSPYSLLTLANTVLTGGSNSAVNTLGTPQGINASDGLSVKIVPVGSTPTVFAPNVTVALVFTQDV